MSEVCFNLLMWFELYVVESKDVWCSFGQTYIFQYLVGSCARAADVKRRWPGEMVCPKQISWLAQ